ncbi:MAG: nucleoside phosphorylase [Eubacteriales bacterium]|nr:nucleoside phosphorylase [Eubacteriales bacterium]
MATVFERFDGSRTAFINPEQTVRPPENFPVRCVTTFAEEMVRIFAGKQGARVIAELVSANGRLPIYEVDFRGRRVALFLSRVGAPACAAGLEEVIAMGAKKIVLFGACGILCEEAARGRLIVPTEAIREEGTSYHYAPPREEIAAQADAVEETVRVMERCGVPYVCGKTWSTDAIYRETEAAIRERRKQGAIAVEMECAAAMAVARFRGVSLPCFLYGADSLDGEQWESRDLMEYGRESGERYLALAMEIAVEGREIGR